MSAIFPLVIRQVCDPSAIAPVLYTMGLRHLNGPAGEEMHNPKIEPPVTERSHPASAALDQLPTSEMLGLMNAADAEIAEAISRAIPNITRAVDSIAERVE